MDAEEQIFSNDVRKDFASLEGTHGFDVTETDRGMEADLGDVSMELWDPRLDMDTGCIVATVRVSTSNAMFVMAVRSIRPYDVFIGLDGAGDADSAEVFVE